MIVSHAGVVKHISSWIKNYLKDNGKQNVIICLENNVRSMAIALLCKTTNIPALYIDLEFTEEIKFFTQSFNIKKIDSDIKFNKIYDNNDILSIVDNWYKLKSSLQASILSFISHTNNGVTIGALDKVKYTLIRSYDKYGDGNVDILPFADLYVSEILNLFNHLTSNNINNTLPFTYDEKNLLEAEIKQARGILDTDLEWIDKQNLRNSIITTETDPVRHKDWLRYTKKQREVIAKVHQIEKLTRHKHNPNKPICNIRDKVWYVK